MNITDQQLTDGIITGLVVAAGVAVFKWRRVGRPTPGSDAPLNSPEMKQARANSEDAMRKLGIKSSTTHNQL